MLNRVEVGEALEQVATGIEIAGVVVIVVGGLIATARMARDGFDGGVWGLALTRYRGDLGLAILLGLEFLVAADIIDTVAVEPSLESVSLLGLIVLIRTFLSWSLEVEIEGRWPWSKGRAGEGRGE